MDSVHELRFLQRLAQAAASTLDAGELVRLVIAETTEAAGADVCSVYLLADDGGHLVLSATNGLRTAGVGRVRLAVGEGVTGWAAEARRPVRVADVRTEPRFRWLAGVDQARFVSMCSVPILSGDRLVGVLNVQTDAPHHFSDAEVELLVAIAAQVAGVLERSRLQHRLEARLEDLRRSEDIHRRFTELTLAGGGLEAILDAIAGQTGAAVALHDEDGERIAGAGDDALPARLAPEVGCGIDRIPVRAGAEVLGWVAAAPGDAPAALRRRALEHGATVLALELSRERAAAEAEARVRGDLVEELLAGPLRGAEASRVAEAAARLRLPLGGPMWVLVIEADEPRGADRATDEAHRRRARRAMEAVAARRPGRILVERGGRTVVLAQGCERPDEVDALGRALLSAAGRATGGALFSCGVCAGPGPPTSLHALAEQARGALAVGRRLGRTGQVMSYRRLGVERLLLQVEPREQVGAYVQEWLGPLIAHEGEGRTPAPLVDTIEALCATGWNMRAAARRLSVHVNTLLYRVERARAVSGRDLDDPDVRLAFGLALRARSLADASEHPDDWRAAGDDGLWRGAPATYSRVHAPA